MKLISYSLYGNQIRYTQPLILNAQEINSFYKGWEMRVYHDNTVPIDIINKLRENNVKLININKTIYLDFAPKFWRFLPIFEDTYDLIIFRDSDSIFTDRESKFVNEWAESNYDFHIIRDHQLHISPILAGMFGIKKKFFALFKHQLLKNKQLFRSKSYNADQIFLADFIYKKIINSCLIHTSYFAFYGEFFEKIKKVEDESKFIGSIYIDEKKSINTIINYDFIVGIPFWFAKILRYKIRPVLYISYYFNLVMRKKVIPFIFIYFCTI